MAADQVDCENAVARRGTGKMSSVWISRASWDKVWSALHNIDLPSGKIGNSQTVYKGPFALSFSEDQKRVLIAAGYCNVNGEFFSVPEGSVALADSMKDGAVICLHVVKDTADGRVGEPEYCAEGPDSERWPLGRIFYRDNVWQLEQYCSPVAVFIFPEECKVAIWKGNLHV